MSDTISWQFARSVRAWQVGAWQAGWQAGSVSTLSHVTTLFSILFREKIEPIRARLGSTFQCQLWLGATRGGNPFHFVPRSRAHFVPRSRAFHFVPRSRAFHFVPRSRAFHFVPRSRACHSRHTHTTFICYVNDTLLKRQKSMIKPDCKMAADLAPKSQPAIALKPP
jgi:hypothetical protein